MLWIQTVPKFDLEDEFITVSSENCIEYTEPNGSYLVIIEAELPSQALLEWASVRTRPTIWINFSPLISFQHSHCVFAFKNLEVREVIKEICRLYHDSFFSWLSPHDLHKYLSEFSQAIICDDAYAQSLPKIPDNGLIYLTGSRDADKSIDYIFNRIETLKLVFDSQQGQTGITISYKEIIFIFHH